MAKQVKYLRQVTLHRENKYGKEKADAVMEIQNVTSGRRQGKETGNGSNGV